MTAQTDLKAALAQTVVPLLRSAGYRGSYPTWRRSSDEGDIAIINIQSSTASTSTDLRCTVNLSVAPEPWLSYQRFRFAQPLAQPPEYLGLFRDRLKATDTLSDPNGWWAVRSPADADKVAADIATQLTTVGLPRLAELLVRSEFEATLAAGTLGFSRRANLDAYFAIADIVMHADSMTHPERDRAVSILANRYPNLERENLADWLRTR